MTKQWIFVLTLALTLCAMPALAVFEEDLLFSAPLDGSFTAEVAKGRAQAVQVIGEEFIAGRRGQAAVIAGEQQTFAFSTRGNLHPDQGTLVFWFSVLDWDPQNVEHAVMLFTAGKEVSFWQRELMGFDLYDANGSLMRAASYHLTTNFAKAWMYRNEWHQFAVSWKNGQAAIYLDGANIAVSRVFTRTPFRFSEQFWFGNGAGAMIPEYSSHKSTPGLNKRTAVDDIAIYQRALDDEEVKLLYQLQAKGEDKAAAGPLFKLTEYPPVGKMDALVIVRHLPNYRKTIARARILFLQGEREVHRQDLGALEHGQYRNLLPTDMLPIGEYTAVCQVLDKKGKVVAESRVPFARHAVPAWVGNDIGKAKIVPPPFTPVKYEHNTLSCWGRVLKYSPASLFPVAITSQSVNLLAGPAMLEVGRGDTWTPVAGSEPTVVSQDETQVTLETTGEAHGIRFIAHQEFCYDGSLWVNLTVAPGKMKRLDGLRLVMPINPEVAKCAAPSYWFDWANLPNFMQGKPTRELPLLPSMYFGNERVGVQWLATNGGRNWHHPGKSTRWPDPSLVTALEHTDMRTLALPLRVAVEGDPAAPQQVTFTSTFIGAPLTLDVPRTVTFCLASTPYKPLPKQMWYFRQKFLHHVGPPYVPEAAPTDTAARKLRPPLGYDGTVLCFQPQFITGREETHVQIIADDEYHQKNLAMLQAYARAHNLPIMQYFSQHISAPVSDEEHLSFPEWETNSFANTVCMSSTYQDYLIYHLKQTVDQGGFSAIYLDNPMPFPCVNRSHGHGYLNADGQVEWEVDLRVEYEFRKRLYVMMAQKWGSDFVFEENVSAFRLAPQQAFNTVILDGENTRLVTLDAEGTPVLGHYVYTGPVKRTDVLSVMRYMYNPEVWGAPVYWFGNNYLPDAPGRPRILGPDRAPWELMHGLLRLHGISSDFASGQHYVGISQAFKAEDLFDLRGDVQFTPWYRAGDLVQSNHDEVKVSVYRKPGGAVMLFVSNLSGERKALKLKFNRQALELPGGELWWYDGYQEECYLTQGEDTISCVMEPYTFRMLMRGVPTGYF